MNAFHLLATQAGDRTDLLTNGSYQVAGLVVVMLSLGLMALLVEGIGRLLRLRHRPPAVTPAVAAPEPAGVPPETLAAIAAAVAVTMQSPHRIVQIRPTGSAWLQAWSLEGRRQIFQSHTLR
jgi:Na+-transporting methylmalonyl-CoA/oxaloacetate decarboxylase gamma subunit